MRNFIFTGNSALYAGAMFNYCYEGSCDITLENGVFSGNQAVAYDGGAVINNSDTEANYIKFVNVTFSGNSAVRDGGAIFNDEAYPEVRNSILWNNKDISGSDTISATIYNYQATVKLTYSLAQGAGGSNGLSVLHARPDLVAE